MKGYEGVRDKLQKNGYLYACVDSAQLVKHAFGLRTVVNRQRGEHCGLTPILFYLYAEPAAWPKDGKPISTSEKAEHWEEIEHFARGVTGDEVTFIACSYRRLLEDWTRNGDAEIRAHADAVNRRFLP